MNKERISNETKRRRYVKPAVTFYKLRIRTPLLAGSDFQTLSINQEEEWPDGEYEPW